MEITIQSIDELDKVVKALLEFSEGRKKMMFYGEMGAGIARIKSGYVRNLKLKTCFYPSIQCGNNPLV